MAREALAEAGQGASTGNPRCGVVLGNLSFPSASMSRHAESVWRGAPSVDARNRFHSGLPAHVVAEALGLGAGAYALDAACASSLYAIKLACDALHDGRADRMVAAAVNGADDLFLHMGFAALSALSPTGQSRPFHPGADGLVPAEGAVAFALERLEDAVRAGRRIFGVIRGVGLSNDGRGRTLLVPSPEGQVRALRQAYAASGLSPLDISLVECHATGTQVGDAAEIKSLAEVFAGASSLPLGSLKSNLGHLITAAGGAALLKVLWAMEARVRPPTLHTEARTPALDGTPFRLLHQAEPWTPLAPGLPLRAGVSAFGFGGNNAHLIVEEWTGAPVSAPKRPQARPRVAVVGLGARVAGGQSAADFAAALGGAATNADAPVQVSLEGLRLPPADLDATLPQQLLMLEAAREATAGLSLDRERTGVLVGMGCDPEVARHGARWRLAQWARDAAPGREPDASWLAKERDGVQPVLTAAGVLGTMPNLVANRINSQLDLGGPSFTVSSEERSGLVALELGMRALQSGELDAVLVGAVDLSREPVHQQALSALGLDRRAGDGAVALVLRRLDDARAAGEPVLALVGDVDASATNAPAIEVQVGAAHAAVGLVRVAAAVIACTQESRRLRVQVDALGGQRSVIGVESVAPIALPPAPARGRTREVPAHPPRVQLTAPRYATQTMAPPPPLPDVLEPVEPDAVPVEPSAAPPPFIPSVATQERSRGLGPNRIRDGESLDSAIGAAGAAATLGMNGGGSPAAEISAAPSTALDAAPDPAPDTAPVESTPTSFAPTAMELPSHVLHELAAQQRRIGEAHRAFLAQQAALHQQFLGMRERTLGVLLSAPVPSLPEVVAAPAAPVAAPAVAPKVELPPPPVAPAQAAARPVPGKVAKSKKNAWREPVGPRFSREQLEVLASGKISEVFGEQFARQDGYHRQVRLPEPPLLLADRVVGIDAAPGSMGTGTLWTETDVRADSWYLHHGHMPAGVMIESGQADLLLISWLGVDFHNRSERVYRLLGCELTYHGGLPEVGETLRYQIQVDGHAKQGDTRLFFFHYDCVNQRGEPRLSVRQGQAGFFTDAELDDSAGVLWDAATAEHRTDGPLDPPAVACTRSAFDAEKVRAFASGDLHGCFGPGFELGQTHSRTPGIADGKMLLFDEVTSFEPRGGPWGRGYLKAKLALTPDSWFFKGHFHHDPCMPGTLMFEGCLQAMGFYLAGLGHTVTRDGWRFEPVAEEPFALRCRGQAIPSSRELIYELFVEEVTGGDTPTLRADLLCTVDGRKAFHARRVGVKLTPDWPLHAWRHGPASDGEQPGSVPVALSSLGGLDGYVETKPAPVVNGFAMDRTSLVACAWGKGSAAFGPMYAPFDSHRRVPRLPGPPYHFITRIARIDGEIGAGKAGGVVEAEYDLPAAAWYFAENTSEVMPFAVLMEVVLQPCGWLASHAGFAALSAKDLLFRNLDGKGTVHRELRPHDGTVRTRSKLTQVSRTAGMVIVTFAVECELLPRGGGAPEPVFTLSTVFGFFPPEAFVNQVGLPPTDAERARRELPDAHVASLGRTAARRQRGALQLPGPMLRMIEDVDIYEPQGGKAGLGYLRAHAEVRADVWFFKAHFFQDPVQPGSLGVEALCQVLQFHLLEQGLADGFVDPAFETVALGGEIEWKYRGQVVPANQRTTLEVEILRVDRTDASVTVVADAWLWADDKRIYQVKNLAVRVAAGRPRASPAEEPSLDLATSPWLADHRPTHTVPSLPFMSVADHLARAALQAHPGEVVVGLRDVTVGRWLALDPGPLRLRTEVGARDGDEVEVTLLAWRDAPVAALSRFERAASGWVQLAVAPPAAPLPSPRPDAALTPSDVYASGRLFHGPAFQLARDVQVGAGVAVSELDATPGAIPVGVLGPGLLDAALHGIPHDGLHAWAPSLADEWVAYPVKLSQARFFGAVPQRGRVQCVAKLEGVADGRARFQLELSHEGRVWAQLGLEEALLPKGPLGAAPPLARTAFLRDRVFTEGVGLTRREGDATVLRSADVRASDWLPGTLTGAYALKEPAPMRERELAIKEHVARLARVHPSEVEVDGPDARVPRWPLQRFLCTAESRDGETWVRGSASLALQPTEDFWATHFPGGPTLLSDLFYGLVTRFVRRVVLADPKAFQAARGRPVLFLANHQVGVESPLFRVVASALIGNPVLTLAKAEHRTSWLGRLSRAGVAQPGSRDPGGMTFFDRANRTALLAVAQELGVALKAGQSVLVHVEGTRSLAGGLPVEKLSSLWVELALKCNVAIVPVRFAGGLPREPLAERVDFPHGFGQQDVLIGAPLAPEVLTPLSLVERKQRVLDAMNALGAPLGAEQPPPGDEAFAAHVAAIQGQGVELERAVCLAVLAERPAPCEQTQAVLHAWSAGEASLGAGTEPWLDGLSRWLLRRT